MPELLLVALTGWPAGAMALGASGAVALAGYAIARRMKFSDLLLAGYGCPPEPSQRIAQLVACADHISGYGLGVLPEFPACAQDPLLARAAGLAAEIANPDELDAALDTDLHSWIAECSRRAEIAGRIGSVVPIAGALGLLTGLLGAGAIAGGWFPAGAAGACVLLSATLLGLVATALGSVRADTCGFADPAAVLDRQLISAAMVGLRRGMSSRDLGGALCGLLPASGQRSETRARAA